MALVHNASFVKNTPGQWKIEADFQSLLEKVSNVALMANLGSEQSAKNLAAVMTDALKTGKPAYFGAESQGSVLTGQALQLAKKEFINQAKGTSNLSDADAQKEFERRAGQTLNIITSGNAYANFPRDTLSSPVDKR